MFTALGPGNEVWNARRPCRCGCGDDDDFWKDDFGGRLDHVAGPISRMQFATRRNLRPCDAYRQYLAYARYDTSDEEEQEAEAEAVPPAPAELPAATQRSDDLFGDTDTEEDEEELDVQERPRPRAKRAQDCRASMHDTRRRCATGTSLVPSA